MSELPNTDEVIEIDEHGVVHAPADDKTTIATLRAELQRVRDGLPGTPLARLSWLLDELAKRFPGAHKPHLSSPPEARFVEALDRKLQRVEGELATANRIAVALVDAERSRDEWKREADRLKNMILGEGGWKQQSETAERERDRERERAARLSTALGGWKCPSCGGSRQYTQRSRQGSEVVVCKICSDGLHPTASAALRGDERTTADATTTNEGSDDNG